MQPRRRQALGIEDSYNFRRIDERLTTSGVVGAARLAELAPAGYELVVNLLPDTSEHAVPGERDIVESQGIEYVHIPVDFRHPVRADFEAFAAAMDAARGRKTHVHCAANYRVSAFYALYAMRHGRWDEATAGAFVDGLWNPEEYPGWPEFLSAMREAIHGG